MSFWLCGFAFFFFLERVWKVVINQKYYKGKFGKLLAQTIFFFLNLIQFIDVAAFIILME